MQDLSRVSYILVINQYLVLGEILSDLYCLLQLVEYQVVLKDSVEMILCYSTGFSLNT